MKIVAIIANIIQLCTMVWIISEEGMDEIFTLFLLTPILSTVAILRSKGSDTFRNSFLGLWLKRKRLEEEKKIQQLKNNC